MGTWSRRSDRVWGWGYLVRVVIGYRGYLVREVMRYRGGLVRVVIGYIWVGRYPVRVQTGYRWGEEVPGKSGDQVLGVPGKSGDQVLGVPN